MVIHWATRLRGFLRHVSAGDPDVGFAGSDGYYEVSSLSGKLKSKLIRSRLLDPVGLFQIVSVSGEDCDFYGSFNRFLSADKPYFLYLENPTALHHYALGRLRFSAGRKRFRRCLEDRKLRYIACMSNACRDSLEKVTMKLPGHIKLATVYPLVPENPHADAQLLRSKSGNETLECLYCVQGKRFLTKGGADVLIAFESMRAQGHKVHLTVITKLSDLDRRTLKMLRASRDVTVLDFTLSYAELEKIYARTNVLVHPSSDDSFGLTVLEAMKGGCAVVATDLYAFPEMVTHGRNGILLEPKYRIFSKDNLPNPQCWPHRRKRRLARKKDPEFVEAIIRAVLKLHEDRELLFAYSQESLQIAGTTFGEQTIRSQWRDVFNTLEGARSNEA